MDSLNVQLADAIRRIELAERELARHEAEALRMRIQDH
jgi:hypothetical protein